MENIDLTLPMGTVLGLAGESGAGKSTTIRCILGNIRPDAGTITVLGRDNRDHFEETKEDIGVVLDTVGFPKGLNPTQIGRVLGKTYRNWDSGLYDEFLRRFRLPADKRVGEFSRGMGMKLGIAAALSHHPKLLILDEATSGLDPVVRDEVVELFYEFTRDEEHSVLISSHLLSDMEKLCDYIAFLDRGRLLLCEEKDELLSRYALVHCSPETLRTMDPEKIVGERHTAYGAQMILRREDVPKGMDAQPIGMAELFIAMVKGGRGA